MSKVVNWGHRLVAALFAVSGAASLWYSIARLPSLIRQHLQEITYYFVMDSLYWIPALLCAWVVFKWRPWARTLGILVSLLDVAFVGIILWGDFNFGRGLRGETVILTLISCSVLTWLFLPAVRAEYLRRDQIA
jgi:hypothetical protein